MAYRAVLIDAVGAFTVKASSEVYGGRADIRLRSYRAELNLRFFRPVLWCQHESVIVRSDGPSHDVDQILSDLLTDT